MDSSHQKRILTGALLLLVPATGLYFGGWVLVAVLALFCGLALWEYLSLFWPQGRLGLKIQAVACAALLLAAFETQNPVWIALALLAGFWCAGFGFLFGYSRSPENADFRDAAVFLAGLVYLPVTFQFFLRLNSLETVLVILAAAVSDTAAFYAGTHLGKRKIWPQISPKKSWAGSVGSLIGCLALCLGLGQAFGQAPWWAFLILGAWLNVAAQMGDFFESALKRALDIKDSGKLLPGHGGLLDRIDSLLLIIPAYALARTLLPFFGQ